jgi:hypothetical protein
MSTIKRFVLAAGVVAAIGGAAGTVGAAAPAPDFDLPADYVQLVDDTQTMTVAVPNTWTDVSTLPLVNNAGTQIPHISAATNYQVYYETFDAPGVELFAIPFDANQQGVLDSYALTGGCAKNETVPFNDGRFVGLHGTWSDCGATGLPEWHLLVVSPPDNSRTLVLIVQITNQSEKPALDNILASFNLGTTLPIGTPGVTVPGVTVPGVTVPGVTVPGVTVPGVTVPGVTVPGVPTIPTVPTPTVPVPTVPGATEVPGVSGPTGPGGVTVPAVTVPAVTVPAVTVPGATVPGAVPPGFVQLVDDTQSITIIVPATWIDINTAPIVGDTGTQTPSIMAATNIADWEATFNAPGARLVQFPFIADPTSLIAEIGLQPGSCPVEVVEPFTNGVYTGNIGRWAQCGSAGTAEYDVIVASPADQSSTFVLMIQSTGPADQAAVATAIASFGPLGAIAPTPTVPAVPTVPGVPPTVPGATTPLPTIPTPATAPGG